MLTAEGFEAPAWWDLAAGARPPQPDDDDEMAPWEQGWQFHASSSRETHFREHVVLPALDRSGQAMLRSQSGPGAASWLRALPVCPEMRVTSERMQIAMRRRLRVPLPMAARRCNGRACLRDLDPLGDHWASCPVSGRLRRRGLPLERTWARVLREAGVRVQWNVMLRDTNLPNIDADDGRRIEIVATGFHWHQGVPLACDATLVSPLHADGTVWDHADAEDGCAIARAEEAKRTTYPELVASSRCRLVVLACETGGRWSKTCAALIRALAAQRSLEAAPQLRAAARFAWASRWWAMLGVAQQSALAATLGESTLGEVDGFVGVPPPLAGIL